MGMKRWICMRDAVTDIKSVMEEGYLENTGGKRIRDDAMD